MAARDLHVANGGVRLAVRDDGGSARRCRCLTACCRNLGVGSTPYADFADDAPAVAPGDCGHSEPGGFEPLGGKGPVARATLYFLLRYAGMIGDEARELQRERLPMLLAWHDAHPVGDSERHRNAAIAELQGDRNLLIDHPDWAERIDFAAGFG